MDIKKYFDTLNINIICSGFANNKEDICCDKNEVAFNKFYYVKSGKFVFDIDGHTLKTTGESIVIVPAHAHHTVTSDKTSKTEVYWIYFDASSAGLNLFELVKSKYIAEEVDDEFMTRILESILYNTENYGEFTKVFEDKSNMLKILSYYFGKAEFGMCKEKVCVKDAIDYIEENIESKLEADDISKELGITKNYCSQMFLSTFGVPTVKFITDIRILKARNLLETTDLKISEIADLSGSLSIESFSRLFKNCVGFSPKKYRHLFGKTIKIDE